LKAIILSKLNKDQQALQTIDLAMKIDPTNRKFYYLRGVLKLNLNDKTACDDLKKAADAGDESSTELIKKYCKGRVS
jgi:hypothetical protein